MPAPDTLLQALVETEVAQTPAWRPILWGTLLAGTLDICAAMISVQLRGIPAIQAVKGVAAGWLGRDAFRGGEGVVALGLISHYAIMAVIVALFYLASRSLPVLTKHWAWAGVAYGAAVYLVMSMIVVPLSAFPRSGPPSLPNVLQNLAIMIVCVGLPIAYVTRRFAAAATVAAAAE
jgi:hypothetical protein